MAVHRVSSWSGGSCRYTDAISVGWATRFEVTLLAPSVESVLAQKRGH